MAPEPYTFKQYQLASANIAFSAGLLTDATVNAWKDALLGWLSMAGSACGALAGSHALQAPVLQSTPSAFIP